MEQSENKGKLFPDKLHKNIRSKFYNVDSDDYGPRIFFENSGGSLRLKSCIENAMKIDAHPDCGGRRQKQADVQESYVKQGYEDIYTMLGTNKGSIITCLSASQVMYKIIGAITNNVNGKNIVVSILEHPSAFDAVQYYANIHNLEIRILECNPSTGAIDISEIERLVDKDTVLLNCMYSSNVTGAVNDIPTIVEVARKINPDLYIVVDAVQHMPHGIVDLDKLDIDGLNFAPYKFFGLRGIGIGWVSPRCSTLAHPRILGTSKENWELGSTAPHIFASISEIFNYVTWIGSQYTDINNRRKLFEIGMEQIALHERALLYYALEGLENVPGLRSMPKIKVHCDGLSLSQRHFVLPIIFANIDASAATQEYINRSIVVFERCSSNYYSKRIVNALNTNGLVRVSPIHCNSLDEIHRFLQVTQEISNL